MFWLMVTGDREWRDPLIVARCLSAARREYDNFGVVTDKSVIGEAARQWAFANAVPVCWVPGRFAARDIKHVPGSEHPPDAILVFHNFVATSKHSREMVESAREKGVKDILVNRKGEQYEWEPDGAE